MSYWHKPKFPVNGLRIHEFDEEDWTTAQKAINDKNK